MFKRESTEEKNQMQNNLFNAKENVYHLPKSLCMFVQTSYIPEQAILCAEPEAISAFPQNLV